MTFAQPPETLCQRELRFDKPALLVGELQEIGSVADLPAGTLQSSSLILKLTTALLDRLAHHATVITTKGKSYRMRKRHDIEATTTAPATKPLRASARS